MSCVGRLCKDYLYLYNSLPQIPTPPLIMAVNIGEALGCPLPSESLWSYLSVPIELSIPYVPTIRSSPFVRRSENCFFRRHSFSKFISIIVSKSMKKTPILKSLKMFKFLHLINITKQQMLSSRTYTWTLILRVGRQNSTSTFALLIRSIQVHPFLL